MRLTRSDPSRPGTLSAQIFWNTGRGFYPDSHVIGVPVDVHPDVAQNLPTRFADPGIHVTDLNNDGRMDLVVFNNDHKDANQQPAPQIVVLLSNGDGTFAETDLPVAAGTRDDVKYWVDNTLRPIQFYPNRLENDEIKLALDAVGQYIPGASILLQAIPVETYVAAGSNAKTPGVAAGWNLATLADTNGDGLIDIVRHVGGNDPAGGFDVLQQTPQWGDELIAVTDEATAWPVLSIDYASEWSDRPEVNDSYQCSYPLSCPKSGLRVVREVTSRLGLTDLNIGDDPLSMGHTWQYAYRDPVANQQGLGFFGFSEFRVRDTEPTHPVETITTFDLRTPDASGTFYPGVGVPATVTVARPILQPGQGKPASAPARLTKTAYSYELRTLNGGANHAVLPQSVQASEWEESVAIAWSGQGPDHLFVSGYAEPATPPIHVDTNVTVDDYGNVTDTVTKTAKGLTTEVQMPTQNDLANWHLGLVSEQAVMTLESAKNAVPVWRTTDYAYTSKGEVDTITLEPNSPDPALQSTTTLSYDDYGLVTGATTTVAGEAPRTRHIAYANAWAGCAGRAPLREPGVGRARQPAMRRRLPPGDVVADLSGRWPADRGDGRQWRADDAHLRCARPSADDDDRRRAAGQRHLRGPPRCVRRPKRPAGDRHGRFAAVVPDVRCARRVVAHELRRLRRAVGQYVRDLRCARAAHGRLAPERGRAGGVDDERIRHAGTHRVDELPGRQQCEPRLQPL